MKYNYNNGRYALYEPGREPDWDNTNHLLEARRSRAEEAADAARLDFADWQSPCHEDPHSKLGGEDAG